jgi:excisionase family DNA binding protein
MTLYRMIPSDEIRSFKLGRVWRLDLNELERFETKGRGK